MSSQPQTQRIHIQADARAVQRRLFLVLLLGILTFAVAMACGHSARAAVKTWTGGGTNNNWGQAANWSSAIVNGDSILFTGNAAPRTTSNNSSNLTSLAGITFDSTATQAFTVSGTATTLTGDIVNNATTGALTQTISLLLTLGAGSNLNFNTSAGGTTTFSGVISSTDASPLTFNNGTAGTVNISGANTYTGATNILGGTVNISGALATSGTINITNATVKVTGALNSTGASVVNSGGILQIGNASNNGTLGGATNPGVTLNAGGQLVFNRNNATGNLSVANVVTGQGALVQNANNNANIITLTGANSYTGGTTITRGTLQLGGNNRLATSGALSFNGTGANGTFDLAGFNQTIGALSGTGTSGRIGNSSTSTLSTLTVTGTGTFGGIIADVAGAGTNKTALTLNAPGNTLTLTGANTFTGGTAIVDGSLVTTGGDNRLAISGNLTLQGGLLDLNGTSQTVGSLLGSGGQIGNSGSTLSTLTVTTTGAFGGAITNGAGSGGVGLTVNGVGQTVTLSGANTYAGPTTIAAGTLNVTGSLNASGAVIIAGAAALSGSGAVGVVTVNDTGILSPGNNQTGTLALSGLTFSNTATVNLAKLADGGSAAILNAGALVANGGSGSVLINVAAGTNALSNGTNYKVIGYSSLGGLSGFSAFQVGSVAGLGGRQTATLFDNTSLSQIELQVNGDTPVWTGAQSSAWNPNGSPVGGAFNWKLQTAGTNTEFLAADQVIFNDTAANKTVTVSNGDVNPVSVLFNSVADYTLQGAAGIAGTSSLAKSGAGTLFINNANSFAGNVTINAGSIQAGNAGALNSNTAVVFGPGATSTAKLQLNAAALTIGGLATDGVTPGSPVVENASASVPATLTVDLASGANTFAGVIQNGIGSAALGLTKSGSGTLTLGGVNTFTGGTSLTAGTLKLNPGATLAGTTGNLTINAGTLDLGGNNQQVAILSGSGGAIGNSAATLSTLTVTGTGTFAGAITDALGPGKVALHFNGPGNTLTLSGANAYTGDTTITAGTLALSGGNNRLAVAGDLILGGGTLDLAGNSQQVASLSGGVGNVVNSGSTLSTLTVTATGTYGGVIENGSGSGLTALTVNGAGQVITLGGTNTYTGGTTISAGTLQLGVGGSLAANSNLNLTAATSRFDLNGNTQQLGEVTLTAGNIGNSSSSPSTLTITGNSTLTGVITNVLGAGSSTVAVHFNGVGNTFTVGGAQTYTGGTTLTGGTLALATGNNRLATTCNLTVNGGTFDLAGRNQTVASLNGSGGTIGNSSAATASTLSVSAGGTFAGVIVDVVGAGASRTALSVIGAGTLTLTGPNTFTGTITLNNGGVLAASDSTVNFADINDGILFNTNGGTLQATVGGIHTAKAITLTGAGTFNTDGHDSVHSGVITGVGLFTKSGAGTLTLSGVPAVTPFSGGIAITGGTLAGFGTSSADTTLGDTTKAITFNGTGATLLATGDITRTGGVVVTTQGAIDSAGFNLTFGATTGAGGLVKGGAGNLSLAAGSSFTGGFTVNGGTVLAAGTTNGTSTIGAVAGALTIGGSGATIQATGPITRTGTLTLNANATIDTGVSAVSFGATTGTGALTKLGPGTLTLAAASTFSGGLVIGGGTVLGSGTTAANTRLGDLTAPITFNGTGATLQAIAAITRSGNVNLTTDGVIDAQTFAVNLGAGVFGGAGSLTKLGTGTFTTTAANNYTGATIINAGNFNASVLANINTPSGIGAGSAGGSAADLIFGGGALVHSAANTATTNRLFTLGNANGLTATLDSSAAANGNRTQFTSTGAIEFGGSGARTLTLAGSNTGNNVFAPLLGDGAGGSTTLVKSGVGRWSVTNANTFTGPTVIQGGTLTAGTLANSLAASAIGVGTGSAADLVLTGGTLQYNAAAPAATDRLFTLGNALGLSGALDSSAASATDTLSFTNAGAIAFGGTGARTFTLTGSNTGANTFAPILGDGDGGATTLIKDGGGTWILTGLNTFTGGVTINGGTLSINSPGNLGANAITFANNAILHAAESFSFNNTLGGTGTVAAAPTKTVTLTGAVQSGAVISTQGQVVLQGTNAGTTNVSAGSTYHVDNPTNSSGNIDTAAGSQVVFAGGGATNSSISGSGRVTKQGSGTVTFSGTRTYTGVTNVEGGRLVVDGSLASDITISSGASLGGHGSTSGTVGGAGAVDPGNSPGIYTSLNTDPTGGLDNNLEFTAANVSPNYLSPTSPLNDVYRLTHATTRFTASLTASNVVSVYLEGITLNSGDVFRGGFYTNVDSLSNINGAAYGFYLEAIGGSVSYSGKTFNLLNPSDWTVGTVQDNADFGSGVVHGYVTQFTYNGGVAAVPEPGSLLLTGIAAVGLGAYRRRVRRGRSAAKLHSMSNVV